MKINNRNGSDGLEVLSSIYETSYINWMQNEVQGNAENVG